MPCGGVIEYSASGYVGTSSSSSSRSSSSSLSMDSVGERYRLLYKSIICDLTLSLPSVSKRVEIYIDIQNNKPPVSKVLV